MKTLFITLATLVSTAALAQTLPTVESVTQSTFIQAACPLCQGGAEVTQTTFTFSEEWCSNPVTSDDYELVINEQSSMSGDVSYNVQIVSNVGQVIDCFGPTRKYTYSITTQELKKNERYVLQNPSVIK